ncbi:hypothetical protein, partial [Mycoplasmoides pneumoniae]|uniref:hypothetical protein n=1 Tax=Mycoplasmoides pneumoniae TaxID=2104 RepID=UPI001F4364BE
ANRDQTLCWSISKIKDLHFVPPLNTLSRLFRSDNKLCKKIWALTRKDSKPNKTKSELNRKIFLKDITILLCLLNGL